MTWHLFLLVWDEAFVDLAARYTIPFLAMPGNIAALADDDRVVLHVYTDESSRVMLETALSPLRPWCTIDVRLFDEGAARQFIGAHYRYELQRNCLRDLLGSIDEGSVVFLDPNLLYSDGTLAALASRRRAGYRAASISVVRVSASAFGSALGQIHDQGNAIDGRRLLDFCLDTLHPLTGTCFVDSPSFTPYPSQVSWRVGGDGFVTRNFLPHPLMVPVSRAGLHSQSTPDYDLILRTTPDEEIFVAADSDEMFAVKMSDDSHHLGRIEGKLSPVARDIGFFLLTCTNQRHKLFADVPCVFHRGERDHRFDEACIASQNFVDEAYLWIKSIAAQNAKPDARLLMYFKSFFGPIEEFMSPQMIPSALSRLL